MPKESQVGNLIILSFRFSLFVWTNLSFYDASVSSVGLNGNLTLRGGSFTNGHNGNGNGGNGADNQWNALNDVQRNILLQAYYTTVNPSELTLCEKSEECSPGLRCDSTWKICVTKGSPHFPPTDGACASQTDCKPMYRCADEKCHLTGPMACRSTGDCLIIPDTVFDCVEFPEIIPGKRCWRGCSSARSCLECEPVTITDMNLTMTTGNLTDNRNTCRVPVDFHSTITCQDGHCLKTLPQQ